MSRTPAAALAVAALKPFRPRNRAEVLSLLGMWTRRDILTPADYRAIIRHFTAGRTR